MSGGGQSPSSEDVAIDGYRDFVLIGTGGFSRVYRAFQPAYDRSVAVKVLTVGDMDEHGQRRFRRECSVTGRLTGHPNIVTVLDSGFTEAGRPFLTMEYFARGSLANRIQDRGALDLASALEIGVKLAGALETAHRFGILHRDIKPQNVLVSGFGEPALADFGISQLAASDISATTDTLTPIHAAPEVIDSNQSSTASDVYSLGSTLYCLLAGRAPFARDDDAGIMPLLLRILREPLPPLGRGAPTDRAVHEVLCQAMAKDPVARHASAARFGESLQALQAHIDRPVTALLYPSDDGSTAPSDRDQRRPEESLGLVVDDRLVVSLDEAASAGAGSLTIDPQDLDGVSDPLDLIALRPHLPRRPETL